MPAVEICPLVPGLPLPVPATGRLRASVPEGYGVEEQIGRASCRERV